MGEYAIRNDGQEIKVGTCEEMYYIRYEDRHKVSHKPGNVDLSKPDEVGACRFRIPFLDEDSLRPGDYTEFNRGLRLYRSLPCDWCKGSGKSQFEQDGNCRRCHGAGTYGHEDFKPTEAPTPGSMFFRHDGAGVQFSLPCYHGEKLPDLGPNVKAHWNGKGYAYELASIRAVYAQGALNTFPVIRCRFCSDQWRSTWAEVLPFVGDDEMRKRLDIRYNVPMTAYECDFSTLTFRPVVN